MYFIAFYYITFNNSEIYANDITLVVKAVDVYDKNPHFKMEFIIKSNLKFYQLLNVKNIVNDIMDCFPLM